MNWKAEWKPLLLIGAVFAACFWLPVGEERFDHAAMESLHLVRWYAREHVLLCLVPAFFIAGAIGVFVSQASVLKYLGARAHKVLAYGVASVSGTILAVCSCTVLPLFAGIYRMGAGIGPATAFLYAGPAINVLAIILTARVLGPELGLARAVGAVGFSVVIGLLMHVIFRKEEQAKVAAQAALPEPEVKRPLWQNAVYFATMVGILVFANWARSGDVRVAFLCCPGGLTTYQVEGTLVSDTGGAVTVLDETGERHVVPAERVRAVERAPAGLYGWVYRARWVLVAALFAAFALMLWKWFERRELGEWVAASWSFAKQILPLLFAGVLVAGLLLGRQDHEGLIPGRWVTSAVGGNSLGANLFASVAGALMYFATLTEVPILEGLLRNGMGNGPALALLLAGPALSLPNLLVIRSVMGTKKTAVYSALVVAMATISGMLYGALVA